LRDGGGFFGEAIRGHVHSRAAVEFDAVAFSAAD